MAGSDVFGPSVNPWTVEQGVLSALQTPPPGGSAPRFIYYLADQERQMGLQPQTLPVPPGPSSYRGGVDADTIEGEWMPTLHVIATPTAQVTYLDTTQYAQDFDIEIICTAGDDNEDTARMIAGTYATAAALLCVQYGSLGMGAQRTRLAAFTKPTLLDAVNARQVCRASVTLQTLMAPSLTTGGPSSWPASPYTAPGALPEAQTVTTTVTPLSLNS